MDIWNQPIPQDLNRFIHCIFVLCWKLAYVKKWLQKDVASLKWSLMLIILALPDSSLYILQRGVWALIRSSLWERSGPSLCRFSVKVTSHQTANVTSTAQGGQSCCPVCVRGWSLVKRSPVKMLIHMKKLNSSCCNKECFSCQSFLSFSRIQTRFFCAEKKCVLFFRLCFYNSNKQ